MTDEQWIELGRRAVACRGWRWLPGMLTMPDCDGRTWRFASIPPDVLCTVQESGRRLRHGCRRAGLVPDLRDPATVGCLLALVREAHGDASGGPVPVTAADRGDTSGGPPVWFVVWSHGPCGDPFHRAEPTEAAALVAALEFDR